MKFKDYLTESKVPVPEGHKFVKSVILDSKYKTNLPNGRWKVTVHRAGRGMGDPLVLYIDGVKQPSFSGKGGEKAAIKHATEIISDGSYKKR